MLRLTLLWCISAKQLARGSLSAHSRKQNFRQTKTALYTSRLRAQTQRANFDLQQEINQAFGEQQRGYAHGRHAMQHAAEDLMYDRAHHAARRAGAAGSVHRTTRDRAADLATARELLHMQESTRRLMKRGRTQRTDAFRAQKQWNR